MPTIAVAPTAYTDNNTVNFVNPTYAYDDGNGYAVSPSMGRNGSCIISYNAFNMSALPYDAQLESVQVSVKSWASNLASAINMNISFETETAVIVPSQTVLINNTPTYYTFNATGNISLSAQAKLLIQYVQTNSKATGTASLDGVCLLLTYTQPTTGGAPIISTVEWSPSQTADINGAVLLKVTVTEQ